MQRSMDENHWFCAGRITESIGIPRLKQGVNQAKAGGKRFGIVSVGPGL